MIKSLRKRHLQIWIALAFLLPAGIIAAWLVVPQPVKDHLLQPVPEQALPMLLKTINKPGFSASLRGSADGAAIQLEWVSKTKLIVPSALIYQVSNGQEDIQQATIVGRIDGQGTYHFPLKKDSTDKLVEFVLYDIIHHKIIDLLIF